MLEPYNIHVSVACPGTYFKEFDDDLGPVNTPMLKLLHIPMSFSITPAQCAQRIYQGLQKDEFHIICSSLYPPFLLMFMLLDSIAFMDS